MAKTAANVLKFIPAKIEIGVVTTPGVEPGAYTEIGYVSDNGVTIKTTELTSGTADGGQFQMGSKGETKCECLEVLNASTIESTYKNQLVTLKLTPIGTVSASNPIVRIKEFLANVSLDSTLTAKGKNVLLVSGTKDILNINDMVTYAIS